MDGNGIFQNLNIALIGDEVVGADKTVLSLLNIHKANIVPVDCNSLSYVVAVQDVPLLSKTNKDIIIDLKHRGATIVDRNWVYDSVRDMRVLDAINYQPFIIDTHRQQLIQEQSQITLPQFMLPSIMSFAPPHANQQPLLSPSQLINTRPDTTYPNYHNVHIPMKPSNHPIPIVQQTRQIMSYQYSWNAQQVADWIGYMIVADQDELKKLQDFIVQEKFDGATFIDVDEQLLKDAGFSNTICNKMKTLKK
ncbi:AbaA [Acrasis kona]|uniref:AbaA n=1 Tax=Acrasis kona TaxID=1008807 RepID=A0AAW2YM92_9EUKA